MAGFAKRSSASCVAYTASHPGSQLSHRSPTPPSFCAMSVNPVAFHGISPDSGVLESVSVTSAIHVAEYTLRRLAVGATNPRAGVPARVACVTVAVAPPTVTVGIETSSSASNVRRRTSPGMPSLRSMALSETYSISRSVGARPSTRGRSESKPTGRTYTRGLTLPYSSVKSETKNAKGPSGVPAGIVCVMVHWSAGPSGMLLVGMTLPVAMVSLAMPTVGLSTGSDVFRVKTTWPPGFTTVTSKSAMVRIGLDDFTVHEFVGSSPALAWVNVVLSTFPYMSARRVKVYVNEPEGLFGGTTHRACHSVEYPVAVVDVLPGMVTDDAGIAAPRHVNVGRDVVSSNVTVINTTSPPPTAQGVAPSSRAVVTVTGAGGVLSMTTFRGVVSTQLGTFTG